LVLAHPANKAAMVANKSGLRNRMAGGCENRRVGVNDGRAGPFENHLLCIPLLILANLLADMKLLGTTTIIRHGADGFMPFEDAWLKSLGLKLGDEVEVEVTPNRSIIIRKPTVKDRRRGGKR
jgi:hypothetical protein